MVSFCITPLTSGWWSGTNTRGQSGLFPSNYVELLAAGASSLPDVNDAPPPPPAPPAPPARPSEAAAAREEEETEQGEVMIAQYE